MRLVWLEERAKIGEKSFQNEIHVVARGQTYIIADERIQRRAGGGRDEVIDPIAGARVRAEEMAGLRGIRPGS